MSFINIFIENTCSVFVKESKLILKNDEKVAEYPIEDINCLLIDCLYNNLTTYSLNSLVESGATIIICNEKHLPSTVVLPFSKYYKRLNVIKQQIEISKPRIKRLWQTIIKQKINNQADCLRFNNKIGYDKMMKYAENVSSGDLNNMEATASVLYFKSLFGDEFTREKDCIINSCLNYAYAIVRALICRHLSARGFESSLGIFHKNQLNNFNLADDVIEPFRPIIDNFVINTIKDEKELTPKLKRELFSVINLNVNIDKQVHSLSNGVEKMVESLLSYYNGNESIVMPSIYNLSKHEYE